VVFFCLCRETRTKSRLTCTCTPPTLNRSRRKRFHFIVNTHAQIPVERCTAPLTAKEEMKTSTTTVTATEQNSQHSPIPPKALSWDVEAAADRASFVIRPSHVDDQHRSDFHREDHLCALLGHDSCFEAWGWEGGVPWLLLRVLLLFLLGGGGGGHCGVVFWRGGSFFLAGYDVGGILDLLAIVEGLVVWGFW
jgi:hypothetical protein